MGVFHRMGSAGQLASVSVSQQRTDDLLAEELERIALDDPEMAEHCTRVAAALPALEVQRAIEDLELESRAA